MKDDQTPTERRWRTSQVKAVRAKELRKTQPPAEQTLWQALRAHRLDGFHFRRQQPIDRFIVDFCCLERWLIVEIDGAVHADQAEYDAARTDALSALGYRVVRWTNDEVEQQLPQVLAALRQHLADE